ncbi:hypothetical protein CANCADRAFT_128568 [Tortispora caseinolytica NRRL Y-17796]|uniref:Uncharacterized protein n=1 Tax=Tortispora caseinolytica NRRL Y-17796 TaxID=767744 RepID=A0A1E4TAP3_9ASCO|nr:hypothetical protein CANCADRAFT_128568 [Tortispora caseinolytica NRRL Y-17796]
MKLGFLLAILCVVVHGLPIAAPAPEPAVPLAGMLGRLALKGLAHLSKLRRMKMITAAPGIKAITKPGVSPSKPFGKFGSISEVAGGATSGLMDAQKKSKKYDVLKGAVIGATGAELAHQAAELISGDGREWFDKEQDTPDRDMTPKGPCSHGQIGNGGLEETSVDENSSCRYDDFYGDENNDQHTQSDYSYLPSLADHSANAQAFAEARSIYNHADEYADYE